MKRVWSVFVCAAALWAGACSGGGGSITTTPPPNLFSNSDLQGQYAFSMSGSAVDPTTGVPVPFTRIGSFIADGKGNITGGNEDVNLIFAGEGASELSFMTGSSYSVNGNGKGTLSLIDSTGTITFSITLVSSTNGYLINLPTDGLSAGSGSFVKQNTNSFEISGISGNYAFDLSGVDPSGTPESIVGQLVSTGGGGLSGIADDNDGAVVNGGLAGAAPESISGNYAADGTQPNDLASFGRGDFSIGGLSGVFYIVGPNEVMLMETTSGGTLLGTALLQSSVPTTTAEINGGFVYAMGGSGSGVPFTRGGKFSASGGALSSVIVDNNNGGQIFDLTGASGATYTIDPSGNGRGTISFTVSGFKDAFTYVFYMVSPTQAFVQDQSLGVIEDGTMLAQGTGTISDTSLAGNYAINWSGVTNTNAGFGEEDVVGATTLNSEALNGTVDINDFGPGGEATGITLTGTVKLNSDPTSRNAITFNLATPAATPITAFGYVAANNNILFVCTQKNVRIMVGVLTPQTP
jgi:hypothetical protein